MRVATTIRSGMQEPISDDQAIELLNYVPLGEYLLEQRGRWRILWHITAGEPPDGAFEPADDWALSVV
jgi:hypothetical protein